MLQSRGHQLPTYGDFIDIHDQPRCGGRRDCHLPLVHREWLKLTGRIDPKFTLANGERLASSEISLLLPIHE
jgi:hypothetical protein